MEEKFLYSDENDTKGCYNNFIKIYIKILIDKGGGEVSQEISFSIL